MENQLIGKIKIKYLPKRLNNTRERQRESKKKGAKQSRRRREETQPNNKNKNNSKHSALVARVARLPFSNSFPRFSLTSYLSVVVLHLSFGPCMRVQGELNQLTLGANKLTCKHFTAKAVASLSHLPLPTDSLQSFPLVLCF